MKTIAAVYTGTGNSLYLAKLIPDAEVHLIEEFMDGRYELPADTERLALVFPAYCFSFLTHAYTPYGCLRVYYSRKGRICTAPFQKKRELPDFPAFPS